ncbi:MAG: acetylornithine deacetylase [Alphaproteobacteria bacterium]|nr:acetylornithine deacetylase [Alphaproteobacteria bacterium]
MTARSPDLLDDTKDLLAKLVSFDTTSRNSNLPIIDFIEDYLATYGVASTRVPDETGEKSSLFATIGPENATGIALSAHTDVVPVDGQDWDTDPFTLTEKGSRLYGRGACDMKGFVACVMAHVPQFAQRQLKTPIHIAFSYDEEVGCTGVRPMIAQMGDRLIKPRMVIVGEPTSMMVVDAHKGPVRWSVDIAGRPAHSSMAPLGVNTIAVAAELIAELSRIEIDLKEVRDERFDPPYTTLQVTEIKGGNASNIVPAATWFGWEIRAMPGADPDAIEGRLRARAQALLPAMREVAPEADIVIRRTNDVPAFAADPESEVLSLSLKLAGQNETFAVSYATEASLFQNAGASSVVCGPGDIAQAHTANEWIEIDELDKCLGFLGRVGDWAEGNA